MAFGAIVGPFVASVAMGNAKEGSWNLPPSIKSGQRIRRVWENAESKANDPSSSSVLDPVEGKVIMAVTPQQALQVQL